MGAFSGTLTQLDRYENAARRTWEESRRLSLVAKRAKELYTKKKEELESTALINKFLIGCDPEFAGVDQGRIVQMNNYFGQSGAVGYDHGGNVGELRPAPAKQAWTLILRMKSLVNTLRDKNLPGRVRAGAIIRAEGRDRGYVTLGGHVHLDVDPYDGVLGRDKIDPAAPFRLPWPEFNARREEFSRTHMSSWDMSQNPMPINHELRVVLLTPIGHQPAPRAFSQEHKDRVAALDCLTKLLEHLDILPLKESEERRVTTEYGKYGDVRVQPGSTEGMRVSQYADYSAYKAARDKAKQSHRTEYRTMASWLFDPVVAYLCLTGAKIAAALPTDTLKVLDGKKSFKALHEWLEMFKEKDLDVARLCERYLCKGHKPLVIDPSLDIRERRQVENKN